MVQHVFLQNSDRATTFLDIMAHRIKHFNISMRQIWRDQIGSQCMPYSTILQLLHTTYWPTPSPWVVNHLDKSQISLPGPRWHATRLLDLLFIAHGRGCWMRFQFGMTSVQHLFYVKKLIVLVKLNGLYMYSIVTENSATCLLWYVVLVAWIFLIIFFNDWKYKKN